jgi:hypothetical protein
MNRHSFLQSQHVAIRASINRVDGNALAADTGTTAQTDPRWPLLESGALRVRLPIVQCMTTPQTRTPRQQVDRRCRVLGIGAGVRKVSSHRNGDQTLADVDGRGSPSFSTTSGLTRSRTMGPLFLINTWYLMRGRDLLVRRV